MSVVSFFGSTKSRNGLREKESKDMFGSHRRIDMTNLQVIQKRFENPDETRNFELGKFEIVQVGNMTIGRATYQPGWKWSTHVGPTVGEKRCSVEHVGMVISGIATVELEDGKVIELHPGAMFYVPAVPHDSWVVGNTPYVSLHFLGADHYAKK